jgi:hypothetical protein
MSNRSSHSLRHADLLVTSIGCLVGAAATASPLQFDVASAWDGWSRPGRVTETVLRLQSQDRVRAELTITSGGQVIHSTVQLAPGAQVRLSVPVQATERIAVKVAPAGMNHERREIGLSLSEAPLLAWVAPGVPAQPTAGFHVIEFDASALPDNAAAYSSIDALVIDRAQVGAITEGQLAALLSFMASCGRTVLISETPSAAGLLQGAVGCGGRNFAEATSADTALASLDRILGSTEAELPHATSLGALGGHELETWYLAVAVLAVGIAATALAGIFSTSLATAVLVPALATAAGLLFMQSRPVDARLLVWAETRSNDRLAQYRGLQRATSPRRGDVDVPVLAVLAEPHACNAGKPSVWSWDAEGRRYTSARFAGRLFATASLCYAGSFPVTRNAVARMSAPGRVELRNPGPASWPPGALVWDGRLHSMPALAPDAALALNAEAGEQPANVVERQAIARTPLDRLAILWPLDLQSVNQAPPDAQAWLLQVGAPTGPVRR